MRGGREARPDRGVLFVAMNGGCSSARRYRSTCISSVLGVSFIEPLRLRPACARRISLGPCVEPITLAIFPDYDGVSRAIHRQDRVDVIVTEVEIAPLGREPRIGSILGLRGRVHRGHAVETALRRSFHPPACTHAGQKNRHSSTSATGARHDLAYSTPPGDILRTLPAPAPRRFCGRSPRT
jgi:hypothetical protein